MRCWCADVGDGSVASVIGRSNDSTTTACLAWPELTPKMGHTLYNLPYFVPYLQDLERAHLCESGRRWQDSKRNERLRPCWMWLVDQTWQELGDKSRLTVLACGLVQFCANVVGKQSGLIRPTSPWCIFANQGAGTDSLTGAGYEPWQWTVELSHWRLVALWLCLIARCKRSIKDCLPALWCATTERVHSQGRATLQSTLQL